MRSSATSLRHSWFPAAAYSGDGMTEQRVINGTDGLGKLVGEELGVSEMAYRRPRNH